ncbi:MAG: histidine phosphatase family protein [Patescibacteria group bacterium UBA2103]
MSKSNTFIFLRHAETKKDPSVPAIDWELTKDGKVKVLELLDDPSFKIIDGVYSSTELKAKKTARPFVEKYEVPFLEVDALKEVKRGEAYLTDEEFQKLKREKLEQRDSAKDGGETANSALIRFSKAMQEIDSNHSGETILVVSHGTILALYFSNLKKDFENIYSYWKNMKFCAFGIIKDGKVQKDISSIDS